MNTTRRARGRHHSRRPGRLPYAWLGAGAMTLGVGAALASGSAVAHADASPPGGASSSNHGGPSASAKSRAVGASSYSPGGAQPAATRPWSAPARARIVPPAKTPGMTAGASRLGGNVAAGALPGSSAGTQSVFGVNAPAAPANPVGAFVLGIRRRVLPIPGSVTASIPDLETKAVTDMGRFAVPAGLPLTNGGPTTSTGAESRTSVAATWLAGARRATEDSFTVPAGDRLAATTKKAVAVTIDPTVEVITTIPVGEVPSAVAVSPDGNYAYVTNFGSPFYQGDSDTVSVIDTATNTVTATIPVGSNPQGLAISPDGSHAYVTNYFTSKVSVIDTAANTVTTTIPVGSHPYSVAISPDGGHAYVPNYADNTVSVIDTATNTVSATIRIGNYHPGGSAVSPDGRYAYVVGNGNFGSRLLVVNTRTNRVRKIIRLRGFATQVAVSPDGRRLYVTEYANDGHNSGTLAVINTAVNTVSTTIPVGEEPTAVAVSPDGSNVYVTNDGSGTLSAIDTVTNTVTTTIPVGDFPGSVAISPDGSHAYITMLDGTVSVISL